MPEKSATLVLVVLGFLAPISASASLIHDEINIAIDFPISGASAAKNQVQVQDPGVEWTAPGITQTGSVTVDVKADRFKVINDLDPQGSATGDSIITLSDLQWIDLFGPVAGRKVTGIKLLTAGGETLFQNSSFDDTSVEVNINGQTKSTLEFEIKTMHSAPVPASAIMMVTGIVGIAGVLRLKQHRRS